MRPILLVLLLALVAFGGSLAGSFHFDDYSLFSDPVIAAASGGWHVWELARTRPLTYFTFWLNYVAGGKDPVAYHAVNLVLHLAAVWLLFDVLARVIPRGAAVAAAGLFALHPIQAEAVNYVFSRSSILMTVFCLLCMRDWLLGRRWRAVAWFAVALLAKEECVALPFFFLLLYLSISRNAAELRQIWVMFGLAVVFGIRTLFAVAVTPGAGVGTQLDMTPVQYFGAQGWAILRYLWLVIVPVGFTVDPDLPLKANWLAWVVVGVLCVAAMRWFSGARAGFWFVAGLLLLLPSSSVLAAADLAADRRMYLPMVGFSACLGLLLSRLPRPVVPVLCCVLCVLSFVRTQVWKTEVSLWSDAVEKGPNKIRPKLQLARALPAGEALPVLLQAKQLAPEDPQVSSELGRVYLENGQPAQALSEFGRQLALAPGDARAMVNRAVALAMLGQGDAAKQDLQRALAKSPCLFEARLNARRLRMAVPEANCRFPDEQQRALADLN